MEWKNLKKDKKFKPTDVKRNFSLDELEKLKKNIEYS
jgi:hypothetical protein